MMGTLLKSIGKKSLHVFAVALLLLTFFTNMNAVLAQDDDSVPSEDPAPIEDSIGDPLVDPLSQDPPVNPIDETLLEKPATHQTIELKNVRGDTAWKQSALATAGLKFMIRGREALAWTIGIEDAGFDNPAIESSYNKVLTIVNSLFILGLLAIALMWMFSLVIPRHHLRKVILVYALAAIFVNFALPINRLLIDSTNLLQKTFLTQDDNPIGIVDIMQSPTYQEALSYTDTREIMTRVEDRHLAIALPSANKVPIVVGAIEPADYSGKITGVIQGVDGQQLVQLNADPPPAQILTLKDNATFDVQLATGTPFNPNQEQAVFSFILMALTGLAYLFMALIFLLRVVILWGLMILSPLLFLLVIFNNTRGYFYNWLNLYGRWLLIGPLLALGISVMVNVWQAVGLPVTSSYNDAGRTFAELSDIHFYLPGSQMPNDLSTTGHMMEYILFLIMLYVPIFFGFALTRSKIWGTAASTATVISGHTQATKGHTHGGGIATVMQENPSIMQTENTPIKAHHLIGGMKNFVSDQIGKMTKAMMPMNLQTSSVTTPHGPMPSASNFLPEQLAVTSVPDMMDLLGANAGSRHGREQVIEKLANPQSLTDSSERKNTQAVAHEIANRATQGNAEAILLQNQIQAKAEGGEADIDNASFSTSQTMIASGGDAGGDILTGIGTPTMIEKTIEKETTMMQPADSATQAEALKNADEKTKEDETAKDDNEKDNEEDVTEKSTENADGSPSKDAGSSDNENGILPAEDVPDPLPSNP
jgi:hypothetical protein